VYITEDSTAFELKAIAEILRTKTQEEWDKRSAALVRLQGLILGGTAEYDSFLHHFEIIKGPLAEMVRFTVISD
jgi:hypothetical protein